MISPGRLVVFVISSVAIACGGGSSTPSAPTPAQPPATTFQGTVAGTASQSGSLSVTVQGTTASGTLRLASGATALTGTADAAGANVSLSGSGFTFTGSVTSGALAGTYTGPGNTSGRFSALSTSNATVTRYCGTYTVSTPLNPINGVTQIYTESGTFNIQVSSNGTVTGTGAAISPEASCCSTISGQVTGATINLTTNEGGSGTGTIGSGSVSGTTGSQSGRGSGTFSGSTSACPQ